MNSTDSTQPDGHPYTQTDLIVAQVRARRLSAASNLVLGSIVLTALLFAGYITRGSSDRADQAEQRATKNGALLVELTTQLDSITKELITTRNQLSTVQAKNQAIDDCSNKLTALVRTGTRDSIGGLVDLVVVISTLMPADRAAQVGPIIDKLTTVRDDYKRATDMTNAWTALPADKQLPCPV